MAHRARRLPGLKTSVSPQAARDTVRLRPDSPRNEHVKPGIFTVVTPIVEGTIGAERLRLMRQSASFQETRFTMRSFQTLLPFALLMLAALLCAGNAEARLGTNEISVLDDAREFNTMPTREQAAGLSRHTIHQGRGIIHEYVDGAGQIYAIAFSGGPTPDLQVLLGTYHGAFVANARHDRRSAVVNTPTLKAQLHGRPGAVSGLVWLPALVPAGVDLEKLK